MHQRRLLHACRQRCPQRVILLWALSWFLLHPAIEATGNKIFPPSPLPYEYSVPSLHSSKHPFVCLRLVQGEVSRSFSKREKGSHYLLTQLIQTHCFWQPSLLLLSALQSQPLARKRLEKFSNVLWGRSFLV